MDRTFDYSDGDTRCQGFLADNGTEGKRPAVLVAPAWRGLDNFAKEKALQLASMGYLALAIDVYGEGQEAANDGEAGKLMRPFFHDRALLQRRVRAALQAIQTIPTCDVEKIGAIGFCFGGLAVVELVRSGAPLKGAVSFHGALTSSIGSEKARTVPLASQVKGSLLILHGYDDPLVSEEDLLNLQRELTEGKVDWQLNIYGHTAHSFTNPDADDAANGMAYNAKTAARAWLAMQNFFKEILGV